VATSAVDDHLDGMSLDARFGVEDVATLVFVLLLLECQNLGDNESGARIIVAKDLPIFIFIHLAVHVHVFQGFHFFITHGVIGAIIIGNHGAPCGALKCLVAAALASETWN
jgi:hypothetical protein